MPRYWFRQKRFGYGATPNTWQGWLFTIAGAALTIGVIIAADFQRDNADAVPADRHRLAADTASRRS